jgi:hypothetical protein
VKSNISNAEVAKTSDKKSITEGSGSETTQKYNADSRVATKGTSSDKKTTAYVATPDSKTKKDYNC